MKSHTVVSPAEWLVARRALLVKKKEFTRLRDELSSARRALPWERVDRVYEFQTADGIRDLGSLFDGRSQPGRLPLHD
jgi:predicted dithiol-disulfide oxidoreductase (DUF899 family)